MTAFSPPPESSIRADVRAMQAYHVSDASGLVKLDAMENPFPLPAPLQAALAQRLAQLALNRYPGAEADRLKTALRQYADVPATHQLVLGNGSDELITLLALAVLRTAPAVLNGQSPQQRQPATILAPQPGFVMYQMVAQLLGMQFVGVPLAADFALDASAMLTAIAQHRPQLVFLAYPNNPTGTLWQTEAMLRCIDAVRQYGGLVVVDEAYQPFASATWLSQVKADPERHTHVLVMRTLSKFGLAGVRLGYLIAPQALAQEVDKVRPPYNVSVLNAECALFALEHADVFAQQAATIRAERDRIISALAALPAYHVWPSQGNMLLLRCQGSVQTGFTDHAAQVFAGLKARGILVKNVSTMHPMLARCLRLTVGTPQENTAMLAALAELA